MHVCVEVLGKLYRLEVIPYSHAEDQLVTSIRANKAPRSTACTVVAPMRSYVVQLLYMCCA